MKHISPRKTNDEIHQMNKIFNHGFHGLTRINEIPSVSSVKSVVEFLRSRLAALCSPTLILCLVFGLINFPVFAQIQQAWVAKYNNGITNGNHHRPDSVHRASWFDLSVLPTPIHRQQQ